MQVTVHAAKTHLSKLIEAALTGEEVVIARGRKPVVKLVALPQGKFKIGLLRHELTGPGGFPRAVGRGRPDAVGRRMRAVLLNTHAWAWTLMGDGRLSERARAGIEQADSVLVSPISFFEIARKVRLSEWPEMEVLVDRLPAFLEEQGGSVASLDPIVCTTAGSMVWQHRDPFDRLLAATAIRYSLPIVSIDPVFDGLVTRLW